MSGCPHANIVHCPLYRAAHHPELLQFGCADSRLDEGGCAVDRGKSYAGSVAALRMVAPRMVAECQWQDELEASREQQAHNMRAAGIQ